MPPLSRQVSSSQSSPESQQIALLLTNIDAKVSKLDEQMQCISDVLSELQGGMQMLIDAQEEEDDEEEDDETDDEATHSTTDDDDAASDMSYVVEDHSSSSPSYDTDDTF